MENGIKQNKLEEGTAIGRKRGPEEEPWDRKMWMDFSDLKEVK